MRLFTWRRLLVALAVTAVGTGLLSPGMAQAAVGVTTSATSVTSSSAVLNWDYTSGWQTVDFIRVGRNGTDAAGNGPWFQDIKPPADGSLTFTNLKPSTSYTLYAELWRGTTKITQSQSPITTASGTTTPPPPPPPPPPSGETPFGYGATGATNTTVRATVSPSGQTGTSTTDVTAINNAITTASSAGGGIVQLNAGTYTINRRVVMKSNVRLQGPDVPTGTQPTAILKAGSAFLTNPLYGGYSVITNSLGAANYTVKDVLADQQGNVLNGNVSGRLSAYLVEARQATNVVFDQVWTRNPFTYSIVFADSTKFGVRNSDTQVNTAGKYDQLDGIHVLQGNSGDVVDNHVDQAFSGAGNDGDDGLVAHTIGAPVSKVNYRNNWVHGGGHGHSLQLAGGSYDITDIVIQNNTFDCTGAATKAGVRFGYYGTQGSKVDRITIGGASGAGNTFRGCSAFAVKLTDGPAFNSIVTYNKADTATGPYLVPAGNGNVVANNTTSP